MNVLLHFTVENFRSIAERKSIVMTPTAIKDEPRSNIAQIGNISFLRTMAIYGANSSGKSNLVQGLNRMKELVLNSVRVNDDDALFYDPFRLNVAKENQPTLYEIAFLTAGARYRYGFTNTDKRIYDEWLIKVEPTGAEIPLFIRNEDGIGIDESRFAEGKDLESRTNDNRLFLSVVGQLGGEIAKSVLRFFHQGINVLSGLDTASYNSYTKVYLDKEMPGHLDMKAFFSRVQLGFKDVIASAQALDNGDFPQLLPTGMSERPQTMVGQDPLKIISSHGVYDEAGRMVETKQFDFDEMESAGTRKLFDLAGRLFEALHTGKVVVVDELDAKMHPLISQELVRLFNDPARNPHQAQLIFTTHDTNLLSSHLLRRDQIWFTEKDEQERTDLYSMMQIVLPDGTKPRGDGNIERNYIRGRYGAIPYITPPIDNA
ncbi:MAG: ATP-binding protein [Bacteroidaceae bacterium]|nr:ATP-binding protein [Bacteroidaceae bacterium]